MPLNPSPLSTVEKIRLHAGIRQFVHSPAKRVAYDLCRIAIPEDHQCDVSTVVVSVDHLQRRLNLPPFVVRAAIHDLMTRGVLRLTGVKTPTGLEYLMDFSPLPYREEVEEPRDQASSRPTQKDVT